jgi:pimeloyl-ACP methyl ester carboxylesterase
MHSCNRYCHGLLKAGYVVFTFDFRSHGSSAHLPGYQSRLWCTDKEVADVLGAIALVRNELAEREIDLPLALFGISRGAGAAILAAKQVRQAKRVSAIIADSAFSTDTVLEYSMKKWAHVFARVRIVYENQHPAFYRFLRWTLLKVARIRFRCRFPLVRKALSHLRKEPIFFIHGQKDSYIRPEQTQKLFQLTHPPRHLWIVPKAKHNQSAIVEPDRYIARTIGFLEKYLPFPTPCRSAVAEDHQSDIAEFFAHNDSACWPTHPHTENEHANKNHRTHSRNHRRTPAQAVQSQTTPLPHRTKSTAARDSTR